MKLADFMHLHAITPGQLRRMLGVKSRSTVLRYINGRVPDRSVLDVIERLSGGAVTLADFVDPDPPNCMRIVIDRRGRPRRAYPWTVIDQHRVDRTANDSSAREHGTSRAVAPPLKPSRLPAGAGGSDEDTWPTPPVRCAMAVLGKRVHLTKRGGVLLDGRISDLRRIMRVANDELRRRGEPPIPYPGVEPLL